MYKVVIIEDETVAVKKLIRLLKEIDPSFEVVEIIESVKQAIKRLPSLEYDLMFMDIHLTDGDAFEIFEHITLSKPIIFVTAFNQYALKAFKYLSIDYLLKPIDQEDLQFATEKFKKHFITESQQQVDFKDLERFLKKETVFKNRFLVQIGKKLKPVSIEEVTHFHSANKITFLNLNTKKSYPIDYSLVQLEKMLDPDQFFRINRQCIVERDSIHHIQMVSPTKMKIILSHHPELALFTSIDRMVKFKNWMR